MSLYDLLQNLPWSLTQLSDAGIVLGTWLAFWLAPPALQRGRWWLPAWFAALNLFLWYAPRAWQPRTNLWIYFGWAQLPWILAALDLAAHGTMARGVSSLSLRALLAWSLFRVMGAVLVLAVLQGDLPPALGMTLAIGEVFTAGLAALLWLVYRPQSLWYRLVLLFWNAYGLTAALSLGIKGLLADPDFPAVRLPYEVHQFWMGFPQAWIPFFWTPLAIIVHALVFYRMYLEWTAPSSLQPAAGEIPG